MGEPGPLALWLAIGAAALAAAAWGLGPAFRRGAEYAAGAPDRPARARRRAAANAFARSPLAAVRGKELRLIARDPWLISQVSLQVVSIGSLGALLWSGGGEPELALAPAISAVSFQLSSSLAWLSLSGEDAPDLLASAPVPAATLRRGKRQAVAALVVALIGLPLLWLAALSPATAAAVAGLAVAALVTATTLQVWHGGPGRRSRFGARHRESKLMGLVEVSLSVLFALSGFLAAMPSAWALAPLALVGALVLLLRPRGASPARP